MIEIKGESSGVTTLESEIKKFANDLPYWKKFIAKDILEGLEISNERIELYYRFMSEDNGLKIPSRIPRPPIEIKFSGDSLENHCSETQFLKLQNIEGVNALQENEVLEFSPNLTIIYGVNGSGKSGYTRLLKQAFYSKAPEKILPNIHTDSPKSINAEFIFTNKDGEVNYQFPKFEGESVFEQFSVFDGKGVIKQLVEKNEFDFRPAGLQFFSKLNNILNKIQERLNEEISLNKPEIDFTLLFQEKSKIQSEIENLSEKTDLNVLKKYTPYNENDDGKLKQVKREYEELSLKSKRKKTEISDLKEILRLLQINRKLFIGNSYYSTRNYLEKIKDSITNHLEAKKLLEKKGAKKFENEGLSGIGNKTWKDFIASAHKYIEIQESEYPENGDVCLYCQQELTENAQKLIQNYKEFLKSQAEKYFNSTKEDLDKIKREVARVDFDLFKDDTLLTNWISKNYPDDLKFFKEIAIRQKALVKDFLDKIENKTVFDWQPIDTSILVHDKLIKALSESIELLEKNAEVNKLKELAEKRIFLEHKETFNHYYPKIIKQVENLKWNNLASRVKFGKRKITEAEKTLSEMFFNKQYIKWFNEECENLNGNFGVDINHIGSGGKSYRQLKLKGNNPNVVLSEGEQKVIALADFMAEMKMSLINRGIVLDDPVSSLDEYRKSIIAKRLATESGSKQVIVFTHDLVFVSSLIEDLKSLDISYQCHWIENAGGEKPGTVYLNNTPSFEKEYRSSHKARQLYAKAKKSGPAEREQILKNGFAALRTSYEALVVFELFKGVVQRFTERVSVESLSSVNFNEELKGEIMESFGHCCRYMEGHSHSDKFAYKKPEEKNLLEEIERFDIIRSKVKGFKG